MFYDKFKALCDEKGVSCTKAAVQIGLSNATPTKWKKTGAMPDGTTLTKVADYFGVSVGELISDDSELEAISDNGLRELLRRNMIRHCEYRMVTQKDLASSLGVSQAAVSHWFNGDNSPNIEVISKIAEILSVSVSDLLEDSAISEQKEKPAAQGSELRDPLIAELISYAEDADPDGIRMLIEMAKRIKDSRKD